MGARGGLVKFDDDREWAENGGVVGTGMKAFRFATFKNVYYQFG